MKIAENTKSFQFDGNSFQGEGWDLLKSIISEHQHILIGEDHFTNEIPKFIEEVAKTAEFDNFYIEVDPYTTEIIKQSFSLSDDERASFNRRYQDLMSFYALQPEYQLLEAFVRGGTNLLGADQIVMNADRLIFDDLAEKTDNKEAKSIYEEISKSSDVGMNKFLEDKDFRNFYFMSTEFADQLEKLEQMELSDLEHEIIAEMRRSIDIYRNQSHSDRVKLLLHYVLNTYPAWKDSKNLFKFGANHLFRGESLLYVRDIGNLVDSIARANYSSSLHILIVGMSGFTGTPFRSFPPSKIDKDNGFYQSHLKPFFDAINAADDQKLWYMFDLRELRRGLLKDEFQLASKNLIRTIKGYDLLIVVPEVTPAKHNDSDNP